MICLATVANAEGAALRKVVFRSKTTNAEPEPMKATWRLECCCHPPHSFLSLAPSARTSASTFAEGFKPSAYG